MSESEDKIFEAKGWGPFAAISIGLAAYVVPNIILGFVLGIAAEVQGKEFEQLLNESSYGMLFAVTLAAALMGLAIIYGYIRKRGGWQEIGLVKFGMNALGKTILAYLSYFGMLIVALLAVGIVLPDINLEQEQEIGFEEATKAIDLVFTFVTLVIIAPIFEEILFRGYALKGLATQFGFWPAAVLINFLFAIAHGQINVAIDTFLLGMTAAWLLYQTKSLWPAILLHGIKNGVAFVLLFVVV